MRRTSTWLTALLLILAVSVVGLASTAAAAGSQAIAAKKKGCKKGYVKKKTKKGSKCVKKKGAAPKKGGGTLPADGQYRLGTEAQLYVSGGGKTVLIRATIPRTEMTCASGTPSRSNGLVSLSMPLAPNGSFSASATTSNGPTDVSGQFTSPTQVKFTASVRDVQGGNTATDLCNGTKTFSGTLTKGY